MSDTKLLCYRSVGPVPWDLVMRRDSGKYAG